MNTEESLYTTSLNVYHYHPIVINSSEFINLWKDTESRISEEDEKLFKKYDSISTYGYLQTKSMCLLLDAYTTYNHSLPRVFYDLGSGLGMPNVMATFLIPTLKRSRGIELSSVRCDIAERIIDTIPPVFKKKIRYYNYSFLDHPTYKDADMIWISNLCFTDLLNSQLCQKLSETLKQGTHIFVSKELEELPHVYHDTFNVPQSWTSSSKVHHYVFGTEHFKN